MRRFICFAWFCIFLSACYAEQPVANFFPANHPMIQYMGRIDRSNVEKPKIWAPGAIIKVMFSGSYCAIKLNDEVLWGKMHNYIQVSVDGEQPVRFKLKDKENLLELAKDLSDGPHTLMIIKDTESGIGYLEVVGFLCEKLLKLPDLPVRKMEFIGDSITSGFGSDESELKCGTGEWYDQHNAFQSYGPVTARNFNAQWHITSDSGIGLIHSCCDKTILMPQVFDKINTNQNLILWDFKQYQPDVVTVCLGQNDGIQDSAAFCSAYVKFATTLRTHYPDAKLLFLTSPMGSADLTAVLKKYLSSIVVNLRAGGDLNNGYFAFSKQYKEGCGSHPSLKEQQEIAGELTAYVKTEMKW